MRAAAPGRASRGPLPGLARLQALAVLYIATWCLFPPMAVGTAWRVALAAAFAGWFAAEFLRNGFARFANGPAAATLGLLLHTALVQLLIGGPADVVRGVQLHILLVCALIAIAYRGARLAELQPIVVPLLGVLTVAAITTLGALGDDPHAARTVVRTSEEALALLRAGVGGYPLVYAAAVVAPFLILVAVSGWRVGPVFLAPVALAAGAACALVIAAGYSIALLVLGAGAAVALLGGGRGGARRLLLAGAAAVLAGAVAALLLDDLLALAEAAATGTKYAKKLADLRESIETGRSVGTASDRAARYLRSLDLFLASPVVGVLSYDPIGKHSTLLDTFARYGPVAGAVALFVLVRLPALLLPPLPPRSRHAPFVVSLTTAAFLLLNNATAAHGAAVYLLAPALAWGFGRRVHARGLRPPPRPASERAPARGTAGPRVGTELRGPPARPPRVRRG